MENNMEDVLYAQHLAGNEKATRDKALNKVAKFLSRSERGIEESRLMKLWKGLYYSLYMADKPLVQEAVAQNISLLIHKCVSFDQKLLFFKCALNTFAREWEGIDNFRVNKFMMLVCRVLRQMLVCLRNVGWKEEEVGAVVYALKTCVIAPEDNQNQHPLGLKMHMADIIMEELAKIGKEDLPHRVILAFIYPYIKVLLLSNVRIYTNRVKKAVFYWLIEQSDAAQGSEEEENAEDNYEMDSSDDQMESDDSEDEDSTANETYTDEKEPLDPRAGGVDVTLSQLRPDYDKIAEIFFSLGSLQALNNKRRGEMYSISKKFAATADGINPFEIPQVNFPEKKDTKTKFIRRLKTFEKTILDEEEMGRSKKKQKYHKKYVDSSNQKRKIDDLLNEDDDAGILPTDLKRPKKKRAKKTATPKANSKTSGKQKDSNLAEEIDVKMKSISNKVDFPFNVCEGPKTKINGKMVKNKISANNNINNISPKNKLNKQKRKQKMKMDSSVTELKSTQESKKKRKTNNINPQSNGSSPVHTPNNATPKQLKRKLDPAENSTNSIVKSPPKNKKVKLGNSDSSTQNLPINIKPAANNKNPKKKRPTKGLSTQLKTTKSKDSTPDPWNEPLKEGEVEIVIQRRKKSVNKKSSPVAAAIDRSARGTPNSRGKTLKINLAKNLEHDIQDYRKKINNNPDIPFSSMSSPNGSVLKPQKARSLQKPLKMSPSAMSHKKKLALKRKASKKVHLRTNKH